MSTPSFKYGNGVWATKEGSSLAYNDDNGNYKPLPFSVTRASSATRVNKQGLIEVVGNDRLRIDYSESANGVALLEPSRTNLVTYSEAFDNAVWIKSGSGGGSTPVIASNNAISPDGTQNADKIDLDLNGSTGSSDWSWVYVSKTSTGSDETFSIYLKAATSNDIGKVIRVGYISYLEVTLTSDWKRVELTQSAAAATYSYGFRLRGSENTSDTASFYAWGGQLEAGSYATSYIPTSGSTATRQADVANGAGVANVFNDSEGVLYADIAALADDATNRAIAVNGSNVNNYIQLGFRNSIGKVFGSHAVGGVTQSVLEYSPNDITLNTKLAFKYKVNDFSLWCNGFEVGVDSVGSIFSSGTLLSVGFDTSTFSNFYGKTKGINVYKTALTDAELEYLTSYRSLAEMVTELNLNAL